MCCSISACELNILPLQLFQLSRVIYSLNLSFFPLFLATLSIVFSSVLNEPKQDKFKSFCFFFTM